MRSKRYTIFDADGDQYEVIEDEDTSIEEMQYNNVEDEEEVIELTIDELNALRQLAARADDILKLLDVENAEHNAVTEELEDEDVMGEEDEMILKTKPQDSKRSFGSLMSKKAPLKDSNDDLDIERAWAKRYGGNR